MPTKKKLRTPKRRPKQEKEISVMAWIENQFGQVLLVKQKRGNRLWSLPGGKARRRETLSAAVERELLEETQLTLASAELTAIFERPEKGNMTFLFRVKIKGRDTIYPKRGEIETAQYSSSLPRKRTPSLAYFWKRHRTSGLKPRSKAKELVPLLG